MDCLGTRKEKHYPDRFLGVQRPRQPSGSKLFCCLSSRFSRRIDDIGAVAIIHQEPLLEMARGVGGKKGEEAAKAIGLSDHSINEINELGEYWSDNDKFAIEMLDQTFPDCPVV